MANIWDEESVSEYDLVAEDALKAEELAEEYSAQPTITEADEEILEEIAEESAFDLNKQESNIVYNARLRLEQAKLYEMLINHNLFDGVEASPEAISNVQNELKFYIVKRLEILLGIREPMVKVQAAEVESPLNDVEVDFLKQLAYKGTLGASAKGQTLTKASQQQTIKPLITTTPSGKLKSLVTAKKAIPMKKQEPVAAPKTPVSRPVVKKQATKSVASTIDSGMGRNLTAQEAEEIAKEELAKNPPKKPFNKMSAKEKADRIKEVNEKHKRPASAAGAKSMPSANELEMQYMNQQASRSMSKNQSDQFNTMLANALAVQKNRGEENE